MFRVTLCASLVFSLAFVSGARGDEPISWIDLLQDNDLTEHWTTNGNWSIDEEGVVSLVPREGESGWSRFDAYLWLNGEYTNFEFEFDYLVQEGGNSGFYFHVGDKTDPVAQGIEVQIYDSGGKSPDARLTDHDAGGVIPGIPPTSNAAHPAGEWNHLNINCIRNDLIIKLNGEVVNQIDLNNSPVADRPNQGFIGFQDHAMPLMLRNVRIRRF